MRGSASRQKEGLSQEAEPLDFGSQAEPRNQEKKSLVPSFPGSSLGMPNTFALPRVKKRVCHRRQSL